jgi:hypothetical protein
MKTTKSGHMIIMKQASDGLPALMAVAETGNRTQSQHEANAGTEVNNNQKAE